MNLQHFQMQWNRFRRHFRRFTWGGAWASSLSPAGRQNLTLFFYDGLFAAASDKIILTYLTVYLLSLGATGSQIGFLSSLSNLVAALILLPAALVVERSGERKRITLSAATGSRLVMLLLAILPMFFLPTNALIWILLGLALLRDVFNNIGYPAWISLTGDIVPIEGRGRYFGTRNFMMGIAGMIVALTIGEMITQIGDPLGYQVAFILAVIFGVISMTFFARIKDPITAESSEINNRSWIKEIFASLKGQKAFLLFSIFTAVWNFSLNIAGPFFNVFMVDTLNFTAAMIGIVTVSNALANLIIQRRVGVLSDKWGNRNVSVLFLLLIPIIPLVWGLWVRQLWHAILIEILGGIFWGAYNLSSFNTLLLKTPEDQRARFSAIHQIVVTLSLAVGAALGALLIPFIDFKGVAILSAGGRWLAAILFVIFVS